MTKLVTRNRCLVLHHSTDASSNKITYYASNIINSKEYKEEKWFYHLMSIQNFIRTCTNVAHVSENQSLSRKKTWTFIKIKIRFMWGDDEYKLLPTARTGRFLILRACLRKRSLSLFERGAGLKIDSTSDSRPKLLSKEDKPEKLCAPSHENLIDSSSEAPELPQIVGLETWSTCFT